MPTQKELNKYTKMFNEALFNEMNKLRKESGLEPMVPPNSSFMRTNQLVSGQKKHLAEFEKIGADTLINDPDFQHKGGAAEQHQEMKQNDKSKYGAVIENCYADPIGEKCFGGDDVAIKKAAEKAAKKTVKTWNNSSTEHHDLIYMEVNSPEKLTKEEKFKKYEKHGERKIKKDYVPNKDTNVQCAINSILLPNKNGLALAVVCNASSPQGSKLVCPKNLTWQKKNPKKGPASQGPDTRKSNKTSILPTREISYLPPNQQIKVKKIRSKVQEASNKGPVKGGVRGRGVRGGGVGGGRGGGGGGGGRGK